MKLQFDYTDFINEEFPAKKEELPSHKKLVEHFDRITALLFDSANQLLKQKKHSGNDLNAQFENIRHTLIANYRLRSINLMKTLEEVKNVDGEGLIDEGTVNIIARSLLESYLVFFNLYKQSSQDLETQKLYFSLYELSSILQFKKYTAAVLKKNSRQNPANLDLDKKTSVLIDQVINNTSYDTLSKKVKDSIVRVKDKKQDFLSFINFSKLIKLSPLPTNFATEYYSYASSFAHSEGFSINISQMLQGNPQKWQLFNKLLKFRLMSVCLYISSQFLISFIEDEQIQSDDDQELDLMQVFSLADYYIKAMNRND